MTKNNYKLYVGLAAGVVVALSAVVYGLSMVFLPCFVQPMGRVFLPVVPVFVGAIIMLINDLK